MTMRSCVFVLLAGAAGLVSAAPVSFSFASVPLMQFAQATYRDLLHRDFVVSSDLVASGKKVTINVKSVDDKALPSFVDQVLLSQGVRSTLRDGVYFLDPASADGPQSVPGADKAATDSAVKPTQAGDAVQQLPVDAHLVDKPKEEVVVLKVMNRPVDFVVQAVNAALGAGVARPAGGSRMVVSVVKDRLDLVRDLVEQLDVGADQIEVSASFVEVSATGSHTSGLSLVSGAVSRKLGVSIEPGQGRASLVAGSYELVLDALAGDGRFKQVSNSRVVGDDAEKLALSVGDETPTIGSTGKDQLGNAVQNVVYRASGVILDVLPRVLGSGRLALQVDGQVSSFQATTNGVSGSPTLVKRQVKTAVSMADGEVLVIGGLTDTKATASTGGFSFLPSTWSTRSSSDSKTDLVLILSARRLAKRDDAAVDRAQN